MTDAAAPPKPKRKGNYKPGPGRPPGRKNNKTLALEEAARQAAASIDGAFEGDAHAFLTAVYCDPAVPPGNPDHGRWAGAEGREAGAVGVALRFGDQRQPRHAAGGGAETGRANRRAEVWGRN